MTALDWAVVGGYISLLCVIGLVQKRRGEGGPTEYFASGRRLPWWAAGTSMIASWFAADTPLLVTGLVREFGVWRNWLWWGTAIAITLTVFLFARLWRRAMVLTEVELTELRYAGRAAAFLRGFKAVYWGLLLNCFLAGAWSMTGLSKVTQAMTGTSATAAVLICAVLAGMYSVLSGFSGVVATDIFQFAVALVGAVVVAAFAVAAAGGWTAVVSAVPPGQLDLLPPPESGMMPWFLSFVLVNWWAWRNVDGGGLLVQRMVSCRSERHAVYATLWFNLFHYTVRCWPWVMVALASIVLIPDAALPPRPGSPGQPDHEMAYAFVIRDVLPAGLRGLIVGWFVAEFMSSINTHTNLGSSMLVNDLYRRFWRKDGSDAHYVAAGRVATVLVLLGAMGTAFVTGDIARSVEVMLQATAGVGVVSVLRWLWWRVNVWTEATAMVLSPVATLAYPFMAPTLLPALGLPDNRLVGLLSVVVLSVVPALALTFATSAEPEAHLVAFYRRVRPPGPGWRRIAALCPDARPDSGLGVLLGLWGLGVLAVYAALFAIHAALFDRPGAFPAGLVSVTAVIVIVRAIPYFEDRTAATGGVGPAAVGGQD